MLNRYNGGGGNINSWSLLSRNVHNIKFYIKTVRVVLVDDHPVIRSGIHSLLLSAPDIQVIGEASNGIKALDLVRQERPDILIMDARMPKMDGPTLVNILQQNKLPVRVLVLSGFNDSQYIYSLFSSGVSGYLLIDEAGEKSSKRSGELHLAIISGSVKALPQK